MSYELLVRKKKKKLNDIERGVKIIYEQMNKVFRNTSAITASW